ncbi:helix-turn-helix domain-containing protein [Actinoplanes sp. NPDC049118]|uniref:helix-turn-helix domain-containing protein n=1 Tax=Actinoplanes sp. NPDC049118 TaxID=3155769 RepID=UPI0033FA055C
MMTRAADSPGGSRGGRHRAERPTAGTPAEPPGTTGRPSNAVLAREHELARMRAKLMDPETAARDLAERLTFAHVNAGKPALSVLGEAVHYSKATLSKVFAGKMVPSWPLVENLAVALRVPPQTVVQEWLHLWTAANTLRRNAAAVRDHAVQPLPGTAATAEASARAGYTCSKCGSWVVDTALHTDWHMQVEPSGRPAPASESIDGGWNAQSREISLIREALATDDDE